MSPKPFDPVTVSELKMFQLCPRLWAARYFFLRGPRVDYSPALSIGTVFHAMMEHWARFVQDGIDISALEEFRYIQNMENIMKLQIEEDAGERGFEAKPSDLNAAVPLAILIRDFWLDPARLGEEIIAIERAGQFPLPCGVPLRYKPDLIVRTKHGVFHRQWKTLASAKGLHDFVRLIKYSMHESAYRHGIMHEFPELAPDYKGTDLVTFPKDAVHAQAKGQECSHCGKKGYLYRAPVYNQTPLRVSDDIDAEKLLTMDTLATQIKDWRVRLNTASDRWMELPENEGSCYTRQRKLCWAFDACQERKCGLDNGLLYTDIDPNERYNQPEEGRDEG